MFMGLNKARESLFPITTILALHWAARLTPAGPSSASFAFHLSPLRHTDCAQHHTISQRTEREDATIPALSSPNFSGSHQRKTLRWWLGLSAPLACHGRFEERIFWTVLLVLLSGRTTVKRSSWEFQRPSYFHCLTLIYQQFSPQRAHSTLPHCLRIFNLPRVQSAWDHRSSDSETAADPQKGNSAIIKDVYFWLWPLMNHIYYIKWSSHFVTVIVFTHSLLNFLQKNIQLGISMRCRHVTVKAQKR